jgi:hypothetical protein
MRGWVDLYRHGFVTGERLLRHLQSRTDADLAPVFSAYLQDPTVAVLRGAPAGVRPE